MIERLKELHPNLPLMPQDVTRLYKEWRTKMTHGKHAELCEQVNCQVAHDFLLVE